MELRGRRRITKQFYYMHIIVNNIKRKHAPPLATNMCHFCHVLNKNPTAPQHHSSHCLDKGNSYSRVSMNRRTYENGRRIQRSNPHSDPIATSVPTPNSDLNNCSICWEKEPNMVFIPCGHMAACETCASQLQDCPICREKITNKQKIYRV